MSLTIESDAVTIYDCESTYNSVGRRAVLNNVLVQQNQNSLSVTTDRDDTKIGYDGPIPDLTNVHLRLWYNSIAFQYIDIKANGGISLYMKDSNNDTAYWFIGGSDTYTGDWLNLVLHTGAAPDLGSVDLTNVVEMGIVHRSNDSDKYLTNTGSWWSSNCWIDYLRYGEGLTCYGELFGINDVAMANSAPGVGFGIALKDNSVTNIYGSLVFGRDSEKTIYSDNMVTMVFSNDLVKAGLYGIKFVGNAENSSEFELLNSVILSEVNKYYLDFEDVRIAKLSLTNNLISGASEIDLLGNITYSNACNNIFNKCGTIQPHGARFENNTINSTTSEIASLKLNRINEINATKDIIYSKYLNKYALYLGLEVSGNITLDGHMFDGSGIDIYWAGTIGVLTIKLVNGCNASTFNTAGGNIEFVTVDNIAIDYDRVSTMIDSSYSETAAILGDSNENIKQLILSMGTAINENKSIIVSKSGNTQMSL